MLVNFSKITNSRINFTQMFSALQNRMAYLRQYFQRTSFQPFCMASIFNWPPFYCRSAHTLMSNINYDKNWPVSMTHALRRTLVKQEQHLYRPAVWLHVRITINGIIRMCWLLMGFLAYWPLPIWLIWAWCLRHRQIYKNRVFPMSIHWRNGVHSITEAIGSF